MQFTVSRRVGEDEMDNCGIADDDLAPGWMWEQ